MALTIELPIITYINTMHTKIIHLDLHFYFKNYNASKEEFALTRCKWQLQEKMCDNFKKLHSIF
jgi:hypothetical protein